MLPGSTRTRKPRDRGGKVDGRSVEIQRLIGRSLRAVVDLDKLGERTLWLDCDVLEADGGTRTAAINGAFVALVDALHAPLQAAEGLPPLPPSPRRRRGPRQRGGGQRRAAATAQALLDLEYVEDRDAEVDLNLVMTGDGRAHRGAGRRRGGDVLARRSSTRMLELGAQGIAAITQAQREALGERWPLG